MKFKFKCTKNVSPQGQFDLDAQGQGQHPRPVDDQNTIQV